MSTVSHSKDTNKPPDSCLITPVVLKELKEDEWKEYWKPKRGDLTWWY